MSTHNVCFPREIRKILCGYLLLSVAMMPSTFPRIIDTLSRALFCIPYKKKGVHSKRKEYASRERSDLIFWKCAGCAGK